MKFKVSARDCILYEYLFILNSELLNILLPNLIRIYVYHSKLQSYAQRAGCCLKCYGHSVLNLGKDPLFHTLWTVDVFCPKQSIVCAIASDVLLQHKQTESLVEALGSYSEGQGHRVRILENIVYPTYQDCFIEPYFVTSSVIVNYYRVTCKQYGLMSTGLRS